MRFIFFFCCLLGSFPFNSYSQSEQNTSSEDLDSLYREDQFYLGFTYNLLTDLPQDVSASGFSGGFHLGFIRDFPLNDRRNIAVGAGLGWSINTYGQTLFIGEEANTGTTIFHSLEALEVEFDSNRFTAQSIEVPLQFRWRTSTADTHKFWRVYTGLQAGYVYYLRSSFQQPGNTVRQTDVPEFNRFRLGATFAFGYNTFNFHFYYGLNPFFKEEATINAEEVGMKTIQIGLMFYIL